MFQPERIIKYHSEYEGVDPVTSKLRFKLDDNFRSSVSMMIKANADKIRFKHIFYGSIQKD